MAIDIFSFWESVPGHSRMHPLDKPVLERVRHGFNLDCLPTPWFGPLRTAPVVLLFLAPGLSPDFDLPFARSKTGQAWVANCRSGNQPLPLADSYRTAHSWWRSRTKLFQSSDDLSTKIAIADIAPYHSAHFDDWLLLGALPSARTMVSWAQDVLFPQALRKERIVVCMRAPAAWGLRSGFQDGYLYGPETTRGGHLCHNEMRRQIVAAVQTKLGLPFTV